MAAVAESIGENAVASVAATDARRITGLDGLRGLSTLAVIISHYFGELPHGLKPVMTGWIAVNIFFVLSGFLIGKLILEKKVHANFFAVFYLRRFCRIIPIYVITVVVVSLLIAVLPRAWTDANISFPEWSYLAFLQGFWMVATNSIGAHWLAPTWTLAVEEHFYLLTPALLVFTPRRWLIPVLAAAAAFALGMRVYGALAGPAAHMAALVLLPGRADLLIFGILGAIAQLDPRTPWSKIMPILRFAPTVCVVLTLGSRLISEDLFYVLNPTLIGFGSLAVILLIVRGQPEGARFESPVLRFFGDKGYCLYLTHLPVLGLMHGLLLGTRPDLARPEQWAVTFAALPVCVLVGFAMTKLIEEPLTAFGRRWRWA